MNLLVFEFKLVDFFDKIILLYFFLDANLWAGATIFSLTASTFSMTCSDCSSTYFSLFSAYSAINLEIY